MAEIIPLRDDPHRDDPHRDDPHRRAELLLPWYVTGLLEEADRAEVAAHLEHCAQCQATVEQERRLGAAVRALPLGADLGWEKLQRRLAPDLSTDRGSRTVAGRGRGWAWGWRHFRSFKVAVAAALAAQAALLAALVIALRPVAPRADYHTLGARDSRGEGNAVVMFAPDLSEQGLRAALNGVGARIVDGPTAGGAYVLSIAAGRRDAALALLRRRRDVLLAQPMDAPGST